MRRDRALVESTGTAAGALSHYSSVRSEVLVHGIHSAQAMHFAHAPPPRQLALRHQGSSAKLKPKLGGGLAPVRSHTFSYGLKSMRDPDGYEIALQTSIIYIIVDYVRAHRWSALARWVKDVCTPVGARPRAPLIV